MPLTPVLEQQRHLVNRVTTGQPSYTVTPCLKSKINKTKKALPSGDKAGTQEVCFSACHSTLTVPGQLCPIGGASPSDFSYGWWRGQKAFTSCPVHYEH